MAENIIPFHLFSEDPPSEMINYCSSFAESGAEAVASTVEEMSGWIVRRVEIFKAGTYRGVAYSEDDLEQMADNFKTLKDSQQFDPVFKKNHSERVEDQIGWIVGVYAEGELLLADIHITDWEAYDKIRSKTWRYLSSEIYTPALAADEFDEVSGYVLRGVAIVSVPKVKGLKGIILNSEILETQEEGNFMDKKQLLAMLAKMGINFSEQEAENLTVEDLEAKLTAKFAELQTPPAEGQQQQQQNFSEGTAQSGIVQMSAEEFVNLSKKYSELEDKVENFSEQVNTLKGESKKHGIEKKVDALVKAGKIVPAEKEGIMEFAEALSDEQSVKYFAALDKRTPVLEFGEVGGQQSNDDDDPEVDAALKAVNTVKTYE
jgi:hypothetical protein